MLRLSPFVVEQPDTVDEAVALLSRLNAEGRAAKIVAGGTDALPNIKHGLHAPDVVVHLGRLRALRGVEDRDDAIVIGALTTLFDLEAHPLLRAHAPALAQAAALVAGPQLRRMGTLGGNLALDTRCAFYNQTHFWREALGYCLKKDGTACHVVAGGQRCVAAASNDTATILLCLDARVTLATPAGERTLALSDLYVGDGAHNTRLGPADVIARVTIPKLASTTGLRRVAAYQKLRHRNAIDFPLLSLGIRIDVDDAGVTREVRCVASALQARPHALPVSTFTDRVVDDAFADELADLAFRKCVPLTNIADDPAWRREMIPVLVRRACADLREQLQRSAR